MNRQLGALALLNPSVTTRPEIDLVFNDGKDMILKSKAGHKFSCLVWANNGDAISRA